MTLVFGIDSGGTKTDFAACDSDANIVSFRRSESIAPTPSLEWIDRFDALLTRESEVISQSKYAVFGLAFHGEDPIYTQTQTDAVRHRFGDQAVVENDVRIAFDGALANRAGVLILAGTGSMAWGSLNGASDAHFRVGGWGAEIGDEGSAYWIGQRALTTVARHLDGRDAQPAFAEAILASIGTSDGDLYTWIYETKDQRKSFAALAATVSKLAESGNHMAQSLLQQAADHLAEHVKTIWRQIGTDIPLEWSYAGGVFKSRILLELVEKRLDTPPIPPRLPPIGGALLRAAQNAGWCVDDGWIAKLSTSFEQVVEGENGT